MSDSLNKGIQKLGDTLSSKLLGASKENPEGASNFSGVYFGPGGGVTRNDSFTIEGNRYGAAFLPVGYFDQTNQWVSDLMSGVVGTLPGITRAESITVGENRYGAAFLPVGYFDQTEQWVSGLMSDVIKTLPGYTKTNSDNELQKFPKTLKDSRSGTEIVYEDVDGPYKHVGNGFIPSGFFDPTTKLWYDSRLSLVLPSDPEGVKRTSGVLFGPVPLDNLDSEESATAKPGFTPVAYFRTGKEIYIGQKNIENNVGIVTGFTEDGDGQEALAYSKKSDNDGFYDRKVSSDYSFKYALEDMKKTYTDNLTPADNEDPLFVGFEIIIDQPNSPLFNGEILKFINKFSSNAEILGRGKVYNDFAAMMIKLFKFSGSPKLYENASGQNEGIIGTPLTEANYKRHYLKKITGLNKLIEANTPSAQSSFTKYRQDLITLGFYEDTTLNLGTLASLYKILYWSRLLGKNVIPENLLRFDCQIIVSEVRNLSRILKTTNSDGAEVLQTLKDNVSRYVYDLYECQLFFDKMTHGDTVDLGGAAPAPVDNYEISFSFKYSTMRFERFNFQNFAYKSVDNKPVNPEKKTSETYSAFDLLGGANSKNLRPLRNGYSGKDLEDTNSELPNWSIVSESRPDRGFIDGQLDDLGSFLSEPNLDSLRQNEKYDLYRKSFDKAVPGQSLERNNFLDTGSDSGPNSSKGESENQIGGGVGDSLRNASTNLLQNNMTISQAGAQVGVGDVLKDAGKNLLQNVKKAALNEAQRQLNNQFRLINNSLDKIRNNFGIGRIPPPTNVYDNPPGGQFFFDVQNSLRNFGGDVLGGLLGG